MALIDEITNLESYTTTAEQIKEKIKTTAENSGVAVENGDTPLSVLDKIGSELPSEENYTEWEAVNAQLEENIGDYANTPQKTLAQKIIDGTVTEITEWDLEGVTTIKPYSFFRVTTLTKATLPEGLIYIRDNAFYYCTNLMTITIPNSVIQVGNYAFYGCEKLEVITLPNNMPNLAQSVLNGCENLKSLIIPENVIRIYDQAIRGCTSLTNIVIPKNVISIGGYAFDGCSSLTEMTILAPTPPTLVNINAISTATTTVYVPAGSKTAYETASVWKDLLTRDNPVTFVELEA